MLLWRYLEDEEVLEVVVMAFLPLERSPVWITFLVPVLVPRRVPVERVPVVEVEVMSPPRIWLMDVLPEEAEAVLAVSLVPPEVLWAIPDEPPGLTPYAISLLGWSGFGPGPGPYG